MDHFLEKIDTHTLSLLQQGDEKAFDTIFWKYNPRVFHFIHSKAALFIDGNKYSFI